MWLSPEEHRKCERRGNAHSELEAKNINYICEATQNICLFGGGTMNAGDLNSAPHDSLTFLLANLHHLFSTSPLAGDLLGPDNGILQPLPLAPPG